MADAELLTRLLSETARGDERAFADLYGRVSSHLYGLLVRILKRRDWAEEALQDCFVRIWQKAETYAPEKGAPMTWLMTIARYRALDLLRQRRPEVSDDDGDGVPEDLRFADPNVDVVDEAEQQESLGRLEECMEGLQDEQKKSVLLAYYEGYTHQELASAMDAPLGTVKSWVRRGLQRLRDCLQDR